MTSDALISIILLTYNRAKFLKDVIQSVVDQTYQNFELLVVDDGSTDNTKQIVSAFKDSRIVYIYQRNKGRSNARNNALKQSKGEFIAFLDSDDFYLPNKLAQQITIFNEKPEYDMIYTSAECIDEDRKIIPLSKGVYIAKDSGYIYEKIAFFVPVTILLPTVMIRRKVYEKIGFFDENMHRFEDTDYWRRISKDFKIYACKTTTCLVTTHSNNDLANLDKWFLISCLNYYCNKIKHEDKGCLSRSLMKSKMANLFNYYRHGLRTTPYSFIKLWWIYFDFVELKYVFSLNYLKRVFCYIVKSFILNKIVQRLKRILSKVLFNLGRK